MTASEIDAITPKQYQDFGSAVAGIMDAYMKGNSSKDSAIVFIQLVGQSFDMKLGEST